MTMMNGGMLDVWVYMCEMVRRGNMVAMMVG